MALLSKHATKLKKEERVAKGFILFFTGLTIIILGWIISYILYRGFWTNKEVLYGVTPQVVTKISLDMEKRESDQQFSFIVNRNVRLKDIPLQGLRKLYNKARRENWGFYNEQDQNVYPFYLKSSDSLSLGVQKYILQGSERESLRSLVTPVASWESMIKKVATTKGGLGYIPSSMVEDLPKGVKVLGIRPYSLVVNPEVLRIENNQRINELTPLQYENFLEGKYTNWKELRGPDIPITFLESTTDSPSSIIGKLRDIPGAYTLIDRSLLGEDLKESFIPIYRPEPGWNLSLRYIFEAPARSGQWGGISYIIINTFFLILFTLLFSTPIGIMAAIYLVEYANQGSLVKILRIGTETLAGIPSIVFGLFGFLFFVNICGLGIGFISSTLTITLMILPTIIRVSEEAIKGVHQNLREGSLALGATKLQTILRVVLPAASPGILAGVILAVGRTVGETAALLYTLGSNYDLVSGPSSSARVLSLHLYILFSEGISFDRAFATAGVLIFIILLTNYLTTHVVHLFNKGQRPS